MLEATYNGSVLLQLQVPGQVRRKDELGVKGGGWVAIGQK